MKKTVLVLIFFGTALLIVSVCNAQVCLTSSGGCHEMGGDPPGPVIVRDCLASGCHDTYDRGNHHTTGTAIAGMCTICHDPNVVADYDDENPLCYPASLLTPTVQSCSKCHQPHANPVGEDPPADPYPFPIYSTG